MRAVFGVVALTLLSLPGPLWAAPCTQATAACTEWVTLAGGPARSLVYRSQPLSARNDRVRRALIVLHGSDRDAQGYFQIGIAAARLEGALDDTIVVAPRFASRDGLTCSDRLAPQEVNWPCEGNSWRSGGAAVGGTVTSFDLADEILRRIANRALFPNIQVIVLSGHSAGGQFVTRYEMANRVHDTLGVPVRYIVSNPSSYAYPDSTRPVSSKGKGDFRPFEARACDSYNKWPYGLDDRRGYAETTSAEQLKRQLVDRPTTYLLGGRDIQPTDGFDGSCAAMAQGPTRLARGRAFAAYLHQRFGAHHVVKIVPDCGHDAQCMFTSELALPVLFPRR